MNLPTLFSYLPEADAVALCKMAEASSLPPTPTRDSIKPMLAGALGLGAGTLAGVATAHLANKAYKAFSGKNIPMHPYVGAVVPVLGAGLGLAYNLAQAHQMEAMRNALENAKHKP